MTNYLTMGNINRKAYIQLISENISEIEKYMPKNSLEKQHTIEVLKWSIDQLYPADGFSREKLEDELLKHQELITWIDEKLEIDEDGNILPPSDFVEMLDFKIKKLK